MQYYLRVKDEMLEPWKAWCALLMTDLRESALDTLREEGLSMERVALLNGTHIFAETDGEAKKADMSKPINRLHKTMRKMCLERSEPPDSIETVEVLYELYV